MKTRSFGHLNNYNIPIPTRIEFEDGTVYAVPPDPGGTGDTYMIDIPLKGVVMIKFEEIIIESPGQA